METLEEIRARHGREKRDLQSRITSKKKSATKKSRKGVNSECDELETTLRLKQEEEIAAVLGESGEVEPQEESEGDGDNAVAKQGAQDDLEDVTNKTDGLALSENGEAEDQTSLAAAGGGKKRNRQKERLARRAQEQEAASVAAEKEAALLPNWKKQERTGMLKAFKEHSLIEKEIRPDGHCLFSAIADQLKEVDIPLGGEGEGYKVVRKVAADYIESHREEFEGFLEEPLGIHVHKIRDTAEWGGHIELMALARSYSIEICVLQNTRMDRFEPDNVEEPKKIWLAYYLHGYGLGEHYNSLRKAP